MPSFDLDNLESTRSVTFRADVGTNSDTNQPVGFVLVGNNSEQFATADREVRAFNIKSNALRMKAKAVLDTTTDEGALDVATAVETQRMIYLKHCVVGWYGFTQGGQDAEFSWESAKRVFIARPGYAERMAAEIENEANFAKG